MASWLLVTGSISLRPAPRRRGRLRSGTSGTTPSGLRTSGSAPAGAHGSSAAVSGQTAFGSSQLVQSEGMGERVRSDTTHSGR